jgi:hypothetical protein
MQEIELNFLSPVEAKLTFVSVRTHERLTYFDKDAKMSGTGKKQPSRSSGTGHTATPDKKWALHEQNRHALDCSCNLTACLRQKFACHSPDCATSYGIDWRSV